MDNDKMELLIMELKLSAEDKETLYDLAGKERKGAEQLPVPDTNLSTIMTGGTMGNENGVTH